MKVEIKEESIKKEREFPKLMKSTYGDVVLMNKDFSGTCVYKAFHNVGHYSNNWASNFFTDFEGSITLSND